MSLSFHEHDMPWKSILEKAIELGYRSHQTDTCGLHIHVNRYTCVNLSNRDTIGFRIFRGTLKLNTLIATLQLVDHICSLAMRLSDDEIRNLSWSGFVGSVSEPELIQYLKERKLYINDPVESEVEL